MLKKVVFCAGFLWGGWWRCPWLGGLLPPQAHPAGRQSDRGNRDDSWPTQPERDSSRILHWRDDRVTDAVCCTGIWNLPEGSLCAALHHWSHREVPQYQQGLGIRRSQLAFCYYFNNVPFFSPNRMTCFSFTVLVSSIAWCASITCLACWFSWLTAVLGVAVKTVDHTAGISNVSLCEYWLIRDPSFDGTLSVSYCRWGRKVHQWQMADDFCREPFNDDKTRWSGLDFPLQSAAEGKLPKEIWI